MASSDRVLRRSTRSSTASLHVVENICEIDPSSHDAEVTPSPTEVGSSGTGGCNESTAGSTKRTRSPAKNERKTRRRNRKGGDCETANQSPAANGSSRGIKLVMESGSRDAFDSDDDCPLASCSKNRKKARKSTKTTVQDEDEDNEPRDVNAIVPSAGEPDGNGGLNQPSPFIVDRSKTSRATCRTCDEIIKKGEVRVGHTPLFRGKPGYMVFRHLHCTIFSENVKSVKDVVGYETLEDDDYKRLVKQVEVSKAKIEEEMEELEPDELVQKSFQGEIRVEPPGLMATLLPFQIEGFSWMRHQETKCESIRGGILADEMGMGKTIQTIATILDNRSKLQHCKPGTKHPFSDDRQERLQEEILWEKAGEDWTNEMDILKVMKKIKSRDGGARAGTLVVCPMIALTQWKTEIEKFTDGTMTVCTYHGPDRESQTPREMLKKFDIVLTTYQVVEVDFRKMTSPNRISCPNCGGKFKIDKLPIHLKYFCGETAQKTEAQARQSRNSDRVGPSRGRRGRRQDRPCGKGTGENKKMDTVILKKEMSDGAVVKSKKSVKNPAESKKMETVIMKKDMSDGAVVKSKKSNKIPAESKKATEKKRLDKYTFTPLSRKRTGSKRTAARKAATLITRSAAEWMPDEESESDTYKSVAETSGDEESEIESSTDGNRKVIQSNDSSESSDSDTSALQRAREKQREAIKKASSRKGQKISPKIYEKKSFSKRSMKKKFDDDSSENSRQSYERSAGGGGVGIDVDYDALVVAAMEGAKNSVLHSLCWWRIILDEAHMIKTRSSQTANAAFSLIGIHRWCLSGTPLQNRVGEFYSLVRFLRLDPMAYYFCRSKGCACKNKHYRIVAGRCEDCGHGGIQHFSHFNKYILNPIQREGYTGDGRRAMFILKNEILDTCLLRRTKETKAADLELPPRIVQIKPIRLHPIEEDFYSALYTQTKSSFNDYVDSGTLLNNYAHIFDLLIRMRQSVDHPYLVIFSNKNTQNGQITPTGERNILANGSADCDLCHEPATDRVVSTCCGAAYCRLCVLEYMSGTTGLSAVDTLSCPSCRAAFSIDLETRADVEDDTALNIVPTSKRQDSNMPSLKELPHVATGSILRRINLAEFATSSKIEALTQELVSMRQKSPGSKAIVFSQFVNMLDLIRWRLHSDPYLEDIGLGARALHGGMNVKARNTCLKEFREDNNVRVLLISLKAGGVALNLTCANYIYLMDPWWNPAAEMQAIDRTHRLGQYRPIRAIRFIAENTVEERILQLQEKKRLVFDGTVGRDAGSLKMLTVDDMKSLFA